mmetsp:Transcript_109250/g.170855  ORF Transcript_109250/g.170855 Transcript_109250/m.170855 type:complete len:232 (-) Transcript_109250:132-827(-)
MPPNLDTNVAKTGSLVANTSATCCNFDANEAPRPRISYGVLLFSASFVGNSNVSKCVWNPISFSSTFSRKPSVSHCFSCALSRVPLSSDDFELLSKTSLSRCTIRCRNLSQFLRSCSAVAISCATRSSEHRKQFSSSSIFSLSSLFSLTNAASFEDSGCLLTTNRSNASSSISASKLAKSASNPLPICFMPNASRSSRCRNIVVTSPIHVGSIFSRFVQGARAPVQAPSLL